MKTVCLFTQNRRLLAIWNDVLSDKYNVKVCTEFDELIRLFDEKTFIVFHDDRDHETVIKELDILHEKCASRNTLVLRTKPSLEEGERLLSHDIAGYGNANMTKEVFLQAMEVIQSGNVWLYPDLMTYVIKKVNQLNDNTDVNVLLNKLSDREKEVAKLISIGESNQMIATDLSISPNTVKLHVASIFEKLSIKSRVALAILLNKNS